MKRPIFPRIFYGWYIVAAAFTILFFNSGARYAFGVMFKPIIQEFGWSRGSLSLVFFVNMVVFSAALMLAGKVYDRRGPRAVIAASTLFISAGFVMTSFISSIGEFFFSYGFLAALGVAGTSTPTIANVTSKWFEKWKGLAISLALAGGSMGHFILVPVLSRFTTSHGWRATFLYCGIAMLLINLALAWRVIKGDPHHLGREPLGSVEESARKTPKNDPPLSSSEDFSLRQAMHTRSYWLFAVIMFICGGGDYFATTHLIAMATDAGISPLTAGNMLGLYGLMSLPGLLLAGPCADWIGNKIPLVLTFTLRVLLCLLIVRYKTIASLYLFAIFFGFTHLVTAPLVPMLIVKLYGGTHLGVLASFINTLHFLGGGLWAYAAGVIFDKSGTYQAAFVLSMIAAAVAAVCSVLIVERRHVKAEASLKQTGIAVLTPADSKPI